MNEWREMQIENIMYIIWAIVAVIAVVIEINTVMQIGWAAVAASFIAIIVNGITKADPIWIEIITFFISWIILWVIFFAVMKRLRKDIHDKEDGYNIFIGMNVKAIQGNNEEYGELKINDKIFRFKSTDEIKKGDIVIIESIKGVTMHVKKEGK